MTGVARYAIYYAAEPDSALDRFGKHLIGYDAYRGDEPAFPEHVAAAFPDWRALTADPRQYGFHATLKAPMALMPGTDLSSLRAACARFADTIRPLPVIKPVVDSISGFVALAPEAPSAELLRLAADCVVEFDPFRAPLSAADRARRNPDALTPRQRAHLDRWGYPFVMQDFRFHMTLTGRLAAERRGPVLALLRQMFLASAIETLEIDRIVLFQQPDAVSRFRVAGSWKLRGGA